MQLPKLINLNKVTNPGIAVDVSEGPEARPEHCRVVELAGRIRLPGQHTVVHL